MWSIRLTFLSAAIFAAASSFAQLGLSVGYGAYYPSSGVLRDVLGSRWDSVGISPSVIRVRNGLELTTDFNGVYRKRGSDSIFLGIASFGLAQSFADPNRPNVKPYVATRLSGTYADYSLGVGSSVYDRTKFLLGWNAEAGIIFNDRFLISARWDQFQKADGLRFDGFSVNLQLQLLKF